MDRRIMRYVPSRDRAPSQTKNTNQDHTYCLRLLLHCLKQVALIKSNTEQQRNIISKTAAAAAAAAH
eukprot:scaffold9377_cov109-Skeletonema_dohrnii-CCMP3373.AAC.4